MIRKFPIPAPTHLSVIGAGFFGIFSVISLYHFITHGHVIFLFKCLYSFMFVLMLLLRRPAVRRDRATTSVLFTFAHIACPLFFDFSVDTGIVPFRMTALMIIAGMTISALAVVDLWDSFGLLPAQRDFKNGGLYRIVRHPIYLGYLICAVAWTLHQPFARNVIVLFLFFVLTAIRIRNEERLLSQDSRYRQYQGHVRFRLVPGMY